MIAVPQTPSLRHVSAQRVAVRVRAGCPDLCSKVIGQSLMTEKWKVPWPSCTRVPQISTATSTTTPASRVSGSSDSRRCQSLRPTGRRALDWPDHSSGCRRWLFSAPTVHYVPYSRPARSPRPARVTWLLMRVTRLTDLHRPDHMHTPRPGQRAEPGRDC